MAKEKKGLFSDQDMTFRGGGERRGGNDKFYHADCLFFLWEMGRKEKTHVIVNTNEVI